MPRKSPRKHSSRCLKTSLNSASRSAFAPGYFQIAKNACLMKRRKRIFEPDHEDSLEDLTREPADGADLPDLRAMRSEQKKTLYDAIRAIPPYFRSVILLRDVEELSTQETAQILDLTEDVVKTRLHRARLALRQAYAAH